MLFTDHSEYTLHPGVMDHHSERMAAFKWRFAQMVIKMPAAVRLHWHSLALFQIKRGLF